MPTTIKLKNSVTTTSAPTSLAQGEVAINVTDKKVWVGNAASTPVQLLGDGATGAFTNLSYTGTLTGGTGVVNLGSGQFYKDASGNVGIGTSSPAAKLDVGYVSGGVAFRIQRDASSRLDFYQGGGVSYIDSSPASAQLAFATVGTERMRIDASGNVIVAGTTATNTGAGRGNITLNGSSSAIISIGTSGSERGYIFTQGTDFIFNATTGALALQTQTATPMTFLTNNTERCRIDSSGNLLVGNTTSVQSSRLEVTSNALAPALLARVNSASDEAQWAVQAQKTTSTNTTAQVFVRFLINNGAAASGSITANGANQATFTSTSDERLKENIVDLPLQLASITALRPVEFDYRDGSGHQIGFIAQEMQEVYPDSVSENSNGMLQIGGWSKTEARLVKAIQEQQALIENLTTRLTALEGN